LLNANKGAVGFILAQELAILTLELDIYFLSTICLEPCSLLLLYKSTLSWWSSQSLATSIYSWVLGLRGLCSQLGTAGRDAVPNPGIMF